MKIEFVVEEKDHVEVLFHGEDVTFANALRDKIMQESGVEFIAVVREHPTAKPPKLILKTKGKSAKELLKSAAKELQKDMHAIAAFAKRKA